MTRVWYWAVTSFTRRFEIGMMSLEYEGRVPRIRRPWGGNQYTSQGVKISVADKEQPPKGFFTLIRVHPCYPWFSPFAGLSRTRASFNGARDREPPSNHGMHGTAR